MENHVSLSKPIAAYLDSAFVLDTPHEPFLKCKVVGVGLYPNEAPTFDLIIDDGALFHYVPATKVFYRTVHQTQKDLHDLVYDNCPDDLRVGVNHLPYLENAHILAFFKHRSEWLEVEKYVFTLDWIYGNLLMHLLIVDGYFAFLPNHKIKVNNNEKWFRPYRKIRGVFRVE